MQNTARFTPDIFRRGGSRVRNLQVPLSALGLRFMAITYLVALVAIPIAVVFFKGFEDGWGAFWKSIHEPSAWFAIKLTLRTALIMAAINTVMGTLTAYVLVKYRFPGKSIFNLLIDLPFAIPTLVTGVMLVLLYGPQTTLGMLFFEKTEHTILYSPNGIVLALLFVSYPFVIRTVQPVLMQLAVNQEEAAHNLGASDWTTFWRVIFPAIRGAIVSGALLSFARALGEFGSIIIVAGNIPMQSQTAPVYIYAKVEGGDLQAASAVSVFLIAIALVITLLVDVFKWRSHHA
jgi:sulfate/thiosulfate transport system permease protein